MRLLTITTLAASAVLMLAGCGSSDSAGEAAQAESVEVPADEAVADTTAMPVEDTGVGASEAAANASAAPASGAADASAAASGAVEAATKAAEKKM